MILVTYAFFNPDGSIDTVWRGIDQPGDKDLEMNTPKDGFFLDLTGQEDLDTRDALDIHIHYAADAKKKKLIRRK